MLDKGVLGSESDGKEEIVGQRENKEGKGQRLSREILEDLVLGSWVETDPFVMPVLWVLGKHSTPCCCLSKGS